MGLWNKMFGGADGCRKAIRDAYTKHVQLAKHRQSPSHDSSHVIGLYGALGLRHRARGTKGGDIQIWNELAPFLAMGEQEAVEALAEYVVFTESPQEAQLPWLRDIVNSALENLSNDSHRKMATIGMRNHVAWCALLTADTAEMMEIWSDSFQHEDEAEKHPVRFDPSLLALPGNGRGKY